MIVYTAYHFTTKPLYDGDLDRQTDMSMLRSVSIIRRRAIKMLLSWNILSTCLFTFKTVWKEI